MPHNHCGLWFGGLVVGVTWWHHNWLFTSYQWVWFTQQWIINDICYCTKYISKYGLDTILASYNPEKSLDFPQNRNNNRPMRVVKIWNAWYIIQIIYKWMCGSQVFVQSLSRPTTNQTLNHHIIGPMDSPHKGLVMKKVFPCHYVIMANQVIAQRTTFTEQLNINLLSSSEKRFHSEKQRLSV